MDSEKFLAKRKAIRQHRRMWRWIYRETLKRKRKVAREEYFFENKKEKVFNNCYCCEFAFETDCFACRDCPLNWCSYADKKKCINKFEKNDRKGLLAKWESAKNWRKAAKLAKQIAELPERDL